VSIKELSNPFGGGYSADTMGYQSQILGNSWEKNCMKRQIYKKKTMIITRMRICKEAH